MDDGKFRSEGEALEALESARAHLIEAGYGVAVELAKKHGAVHAQMVFGTMVERNLIDEDDLGKPANWLANVFKGKRYKDSWEKIGHRRIGNKERNVHAAPRMVWKLKNTPDPVGSVKDDETCPLCQRKPDPEKPSFAVIRRALEVFRRAHKEGFRSKDTVSVGQWLMKISDDA
jgi:hypothetical protein